MKILYSQRIILVLLIVSMLSGSCSTFMSKAAARKAERQMAGSSRSSKAPRESRKVRLAKKQQESRQGKLKKQYSKHIKDSRERTYDIQSPAVKERIKQNEAAISAREKAKDKRARNASKKAGRKYR